MHSFVARQRGDVPTNFANGIAVHGMDWMPRIFRVVQFFTCAICAVLPVACSKVPSGEQTPVVVAAPTPEPAPLQLPPPEPVSEEPIGPATAPPPQQPADSNALERRFLSAQNDPAERIAVIQDLADVPPAAALAFLNRLYPVERREDVKMEMLSALGDLDHEQNRNEQLALCMKALAAGQPARVRYVAVQLLGELRDPRGHAMLKTLTTDSDREVRAAAVQMVRDLRED